MLPRRVLLLGLAVTCALTAAACGGGSPSGASPIAQAAPDIGLSTGAVLSVVSGETGEPVPGARVSVATRSYDTDAVGRIVLAEPAAYGAFVDVVANGFFDRQTLIRRDAAPRIVLWPRATGGRSGLYEAYTATLVYTGTGTPAPATGSASLRRPRRGETLATVVLSEGLLQDEGAHVAHLRAVSAMNEALAGRLTYTLAPTRPTSGLVFDARVDPADATCAAGGARAFAQVTTQSGEVSGGRIVYCDRYQASAEIVLHELGHTVGFHHSLEFDDVMHPWSLRASRFSRNENVLLGLLFERTGGNRFPDNDRDVAAAARETVTIVCH